MQAGQPVPAVWINFEPLRLLGPVAPHPGRPLGEDRPGRPLRLPAGPADEGERAGPALRLAGFPAQLQPGPSRWTSGRGNAEVDLGGEGTIVKGRVVLSGDAAPKIDLHKSLNCLIRRAPGIEPPAEIRVARLHGRRGWNNVWTASPEGHAFLQTLHNHFVDAGPGRPVPDQRRPGRRL